MNTFEEVYQELEKMGTAQNRKVYQRHGASENLFGVSYANFKKLKKEIQSEKGKKGTNQGIARQLWNTGNYDARIFAAMIADPNETTHEELMKWAAEVDSYPLADAFSDLAAKTPHAQAMMDDWIESKAEYERRIGYSVLNRLTKTKNWDTDFYEPYIQKIERQLQKSPNRAKEGMNNCLISIGAVNEGLRARVLEASEKIGPVEIDHGETNCKTFDVKEYLDRIYSRKNKKQA